MKVMRNEVQMTRMKRAGQGTGFLGLMILLGGLYFSLQGNEGLLIWQWLFLLVGILIWQVSINISHRYVRQPRPDQMLDVALKSVQSSTLYHYVLPARHVLLTRAGPIVLIPKTQTGKFAVSGEEGDKWKRTGPIYKRIFKSMFGQEPGFTNPTREALYEVGQLIELINKEAPELEEIMIGTMIVFTGPSNMVEISGEENSRIPVIRMRDLKKYIRKHSGRPLPKNQFNQLKEIFNTAAGDDVEPVNVAS